MNVPSTTWVDLLHPPSSERASKRGSVSINPNTPRTTKTYSRIPQGQVEILRSQVVSLLQEKQELIKKVSGYYLIRGILWEGPMFDVYSV